MIKDDKILKEPLNFEAFMNVIRFFSVNEYVEGSFTNDDWQLYIKPTPEGLQIADYYEAYEDETKARILTIPMPTKLQEALDSLNIIFDGLPEWSEEDKKELIEDYRKEVSGVRYISLKELYNRSW